METVEDLMHKRHRRRKRGSRGLAKARCVRKCRAKNGKGRFARKHKRTLGACRRTCGVKAR